MANTYKCSEVMDSCIYCGRIEHDSKCCNYLYKTGHRRMCDPEECDKYIRKTDTNIRLIGLNSKNDDSDLDSEFLNWRTYEE